MPIFAENAEKQRLLELLRSIRQEAGVSQEDLARRLGRPQSFVSKYEMGERRIDVLELRLICQALGTGMTDFVKRLDAQLDESKSLVP
jgi:transcriptional regulator with XRE-family HTH domain